MTALCLLPLMAFAAFGVDLASFYSRASYLQKSADAAALAGTVWMPNLTKARQIACDSLLNNNIDGGDCGTGTFNVTIDPGSTANSLLVTVTDPSATRYFSQVFGNGDQALTRSAEAEYNLPLPLGSPLNYFGGDADRTIIPAVPPTHGVAWPNPYNNSRRPAVATAWGDRAGLSLPRRDHAGGRGRVRELDEHLQLDSVDRDRVLLLRSHRHALERLERRSAARLHGAPPGRELAGLAQPLSGPPGRHLTGTVLGSWSGGTYTNGVGGTGNPCTWRPAATNSASLTPLGASGLTDTWYQTDLTKVPTNRPCNVGWTSATGGYASGGGVERRNVLQRCRGHQRQPPVPLAVVQLRLQPWIARVEPHRGQPQPWLLGRDPRSRRRHRPR